MAVLIRCLNVVRLGVTPSSGVNAASCDRPVQQDMQALHPKMDKGILRQSAGSQPVGSIEFVENYNATLPSKNHFKLPPNFVYPDLVILVDALMNAEFMLDGVSWITDRGAV